MLDLRGNFKTGKVERKCRKCEIEEETQQHLLECPALRDNSLVVGRPNYQDLFGAEPSIIGNILKFKFKLLQSVTPGAPTSAATTLDNIVVELDNKKKKKKKKTLSIIM